MAAIDVITVYERLNYVLYEHGKNNRENYDIKFQKELYQRWLEKLQTNPKETEKFIIKEQERMLIEIAKHLELEIETYPEECVYTIKCAWSIETNDYEQIEEVRLKLHLMQILLILTECIATFKISVEKVSEACPMNYLPILEVVVTMIF